jgi:hypothetical protein
MNSIHLAEDKAYVSCWGSVNTVQQLTFEFHKCRELFDQLSNYKLLKNVPAF